MQIDPVETFAVADRVSIAVDRIRKRGREVGKVHIHEIGRRFHDGVPYRHGYPFRHDACGYRAAVGDTGEKLTAEKLLKT